MENNINLKRDLAKALGLEGVRNITNITLNIPVKDAITIDVKVIVTGNFAGKIGEALKEYELIKKVKEDGK